VDAVRTAVLVLALAVVSSVGAAGSRSGMHRVENPVAGWTVALPVGWHMAVNRQDGSAQIGTFPLGATPDLSSVRVPRGQTWVYLFDEGPPAGLTPWQRRHIGSLPARLPAVKPYEGVGPARRLEFWVGGNAFLAAVKGRPRPAVLRILGSARLTARGRALANVHSVRLLGHSVEGRPIRAWRVGNPRSQPRILVVGCIHGTECAGMAITQRLVDLARPINFDLWVVQDLNPDGLAAGTRQNAHGVDLNRNFGSVWKRIGSRGTWDYSGPRPWSEPEARIARALILRVRPDVTLWFHQPEAVVRAWGKSIPAARRYARLARVPFREIPWPNGTAPNWQNHLREVSFVVELPPGALSRSAANRYANAILRLGT
jgi:protein MpaA